MGEHADPYRRVRRRRWTLGLIAVFIPVLVLLHGTLFNRWYLTPGLAAEAFGHAGLPVTKALDTTSEECGAHLRCREALQAEELSIYQFWFREDAREFAESLGASAHQSDWIVLRYEDANNNEPSEPSYAGIIDGMWTSN